MTGQNGQNGQNGPTETPSPPFAASEATPFSSSVEAPTAEAVSDGSSPPFPLFPPSPAAPAGPLPWEHAITMATMATMATEAPTDLPIDPIDPIDPSLRPTTPPTTTSRQRVRHSFDVFSDQVLSLRDISLKREQRSGLRTRLGALVQEALDTFIAHEAVAGQSPQTDQSAEPGGHEEHEARGVTLPVDNRLDKRQAGTQGGTTAT